MALKRASIPALPPRRREVFCAPLGDSVVIQTMSLQQMLAFDDARKSVQEPVVGETESQRTARVLDVLMPYVLAMCVIAEDDGQPLYSEDEWRGWCAAHLTEAYDLFTAATEVVSVEAQKKT